MVTNLVIQKEEKEVLTLKPEAFESKIKIAFLGGMEWHGMVW